MVSEFTALGARRASAGLKPAGARRFFSASAGLARHLFLLLAWTALAGCATPREAPGDAKRLAACLAGLPGVKAEEAALAAETACQRSAELAREYRVVRPAVWHNVLVNWGVKSRGLCYHWAEDLEASLGRLRLSTLQVRRGVARKDTRREHNCVVLTATGQSFTNGIVLDAWRHSGRLYWVPVSEDRYPWREGALTYSTNFPPAFPEQPRP